MLNLFVLAGAPGTGKSTVFNQLRARGFAGMNEAARAVLDEQLATQGPALPSNNPLLFIQTMQKKNIANFASAEKLTGPVFFDRGLPDLVHYAVRFNVDATEFEASSKKYRYNSNVFIFSPWKEIFVNDNVRPMPFEKTLEIQDLIVRAYAGSGYNLIEVPKGTAEARADFILEKVNSL